MLSVIDIIPISAHIFKLTSWDYWQEDKQATTSNTIKQSSAHYVATLF